MADLDSAVKIREFIQPLWKSDDPKFNGNALLGRITRFVNSPSDKSELSVAFDATRENICGHVAMSSKVKVKIIKLIKEVDSLMVLKILVPNF
jgi:hypothetical protein